MWWIFLIVALHELKTLLQYTVFSSPSPIKSIARVVNRGMLISILQSDRRGGFVRNAHFMLSRNSTKAWSKESTRINPKRGYSISRMT
jgi:hypothetical protein